MKVYVLNNGEKTLFFAGTLTRQVWKQIKVQCKWYFGWNKINVLRVGNEVYLMDGQKIETLRKEFFEKKGVAV